MQPHPEIRPGSVIHGTMLACDLIPAFIAELASYDQEISPWILEIAERLEENPDYQDSEDAGYVDEACCALFDQLDALGGENYYFGAHVGDGSDYGFWPTSDLP